MQTIDIELMYALKEVELDASGYIESEIKLQMRKESTRVLLSPQKEV